MGLLDNFNLDALNSDQGRLALGLLDAAGPQERPRSIGQRVAGAFNDLRRQKMAEDEMRMKQQYMQAQMADIQQQAELRRAQVENQRGAASDLANILGAPGKQSQYDTAGGGISLGGQREPMVPQPGGLGAATLEQIAAYKARPGGADLTPQWELAKFGKTINPGTYTQGVNGDMKYNLDPTKGMGFDVKSQSLYRLGGADTLATLAGESAGATTAAQEREKARTEVGTYNLPDGSTVQMPKSEFLSGRLGASAGAPPRIAALAARNGDENYSFDIGGRQGSVGSIGGPQLGRSQTPTAKMAEEVVSAADKERQVGGIKNLNEYETNINAKVGAGRELVRRVNEQEKLLDQFKTGATAGTRSKLALIARDMGAPDSLVTRIGGGDPTAAQEFTKFAAQTNLEQLKQAIGANRMLKTEFDAFSEANPSIASDPQAIRKVFSWLRDTYAKDYDEQQALRKYKKSGADPADFQGWYSEQKHGEVMNPPKDVPKPLQNVTEADIRATAFKHGKTVEQVRKDLGL